MAAKDEMFWLGAGVVQIDGKEYGADMPLPVSKVDKDTLKRWKDSGKVGGKLKAGGVDVDAVLANLQGDLKEARDVISAQVKQADADQEKISDLEKQVEDLTDPDAKGKDDSAKDGKDGKE